MIRQYLSSHSYVPSAPSHTEGSRAGYSFDRINPDENVDFRTQKGREILYILSKRDPTCWRIKNAIPALSVARGFKIIPQSPEAREVIKKFLYSLHKTDPITALLVAVRQLAEDSVWSGNGFWEKQYSKDWSFRDDPFEVKGNSIVGLKKIHPLTMDLKRDYSGEVLIDEKGDFGPPDEFLAYSQTLTLKGQWKSRDIDKRRIAHLKFNTIGDEVLGISDYEPIYATIKRSASIQDGIAQGAFRHGVPFLDITVGDEQHPPDKEMLDNARDEVKDSSYMSEFVHPPWYKTEMHEQFSLSKSKGMLEPFNALIATSTGIPFSVLAGSGEGTNKSTVSELINLIQPLIIAPRQHALKLFLEEQIFCPLMEMSKIDGVPLIQWNELFPADYSIADKLKVMSSILIEKKPLLSWVEAREILRFPSQEEGTFYSLSRENLSGNSRAINLPEPHGKMIYEGNETAILSDNIAPSMLGVPLELISGNKSYGKIRLTGSTLIDKKGFEKYSSQHRVTEDEYRERFKDSSYLFKFEILNLHKIPKLVNVESKTFLSNFSYKKDIIDLSFGSRLDEK